MIGFGRISGLLVVVVLSLWLGIDVGMKLAMGILFLFPLIFAWVLNIEE